MDKGRILVVDGNNSVAESNARVLRSLGYHTRTDVNAQRLLAPDEVAATELLLLEISAPQIGGVDFVRNLKRRYPYIGIIVTTYVNDPVQIVNAVKCGAFSCLLNPLAPELLVTTVSDYFRANPPHLLEDPHFSSFITGDTKFQEIFRRIKLFAEADVPALIHGETGTGKELVAQIIHSLSLRSQEPFIGVNVAALSANLFESELFGHCKGAFTGSTGDKKGYLELARSGTIFLDEIGELEFEQQKKLLRVLETRRFSPVGSTVEQKLNARIAFATNRDLTTDVKEGRFREDLFYRIANHAVYLPPLRERTGDIKLLAKHFLTKYCAQYRKNIDGFDQEAMTILENHPFPGNVRELDGVINAAVLLEQGHMITCKSLPPYLKITPAYPNNNTSDLKALRYRTIMNTLARYHGNQTKAAQELGIARATLNRFLKEFKERKPAVDH